MPDRRFKVITARKGHSPGRPLQIIFPEDDFRRMAADFAAQETAGREGYAVALCGTRSGAEKRSAAYLVRSMHIPGKGDLIDHSSVSVTPSADFMEAVLARAMDRRSQVLEIHTHPGSASPCFSAVDIDHGLDNGRFLKSCRTGFGMLVLGTEGFALREYRAEDDSLQSPEVTRISIMTRTGLVDLFKPAEKPRCEQLSPTLDRQVHIWGEDCQRKIGAVTAALSAWAAPGPSCCRCWSGSAVRKFVLCDPDVIEVSNISRLPYAFDDDVGRKKVKVAARYVKRMAGEASVKMISDRVQEAGESLRACDMLFGCADNDGARLALNDFRSSTSYLTSIPAPRSSSRRAGQGDGRPGTSGCARGHGLPRMRGCHRPRAGSDQLAVRQGYAHAERGRIRKWHWLFSRAGQSLP